MAGRSVISKQAMAFHGLTVGTIKSYSDGSSTCKLKKDSPLVQAMFNTLVDEVTKAGFIQDPEIPHMFHYQMAVEDANDVIDEVNAEAKILTEDELDNIRNNEESAPNGTD